MVYLKDIFENVSVENQPTTIFFKKNVPVCIELALGPLSEHMPRDLPRCEKSPLLSVSMARYTNNKGRLWLEYTYNIVFQSW